MEYMEKDSFGSFGSVEFYDSAEDMEYMEKDSLALWLLRVL